jgi:hypothetical protein
MAGRDDDFQDPFANFNDDFGDGSLEGDLDGEFGSLDNKEFLAETELPVGGDGFDEYGEPIVSSTALEDESADDSDQGYQQAAPSPRAKPVAQSQVVEPKPFLKTPVGMIAAGAGTLMLCVVGTVGYNSLSGSPQPLPALPEANNDVVAPRAGDPNYNSKSQPVAASMAVIVEPKPVVKPVINQVEPEVSPQAVPTLKAGVDQVNPSVVQGGASSDELSRVKVALARQHEETEELKSVVASLSRGIDKISAYAEKDHVEQVAIRDQLDALNKQLAQAPAPAVAPETTPAVTPKLSAAQQLAVKVAAKSANEAPKAEQPNASSTQNPQAEGRFRLAGLKVVEATESGKMSVVSKTSNGRVYTLFKGEKLGTPRGSLPVTEIKDDGFLIFVGDKYYIDRVAEEKPVAAPVAATPAPARAPAPSKPSRASRSKERSSSTPTSGPSKSTSYTLNAVYDNGNAFGLVNGDGDFKSYKMGEEVPGVGRITGVDENGNLKAGDSVIKSLY